MKKGKLVYLDTIETDDLEQLRNWRNFENFKRNFREYREISKTMQNKWFNEIVNDNFFNHMFAIRETKSKNLIGCIGLTYINWIYKNADLSIYIGENNHYIDDKKALEATKIILDYGFNQLNLHKIWTEIYEFDNIKKNFFDMLGFSVDGTLRDNYYYSGKYWDSIILSILSREFDLEKGGF